MRRGGRAAMPRFTIAMSACLLMACGSSGPSGTGAGGGSNGADGAGAGGSGGRAGASALGGSGGASGRAGSGTAGNGGAAGGLAQGGASGGTAGQGMSGSPGGAAGGAGAASGGAGGRAFGAPSGSGAGGAGHGGVGCPPCPDSPRSLLQTRRQTRDRRFLSSPARRHRGREGPDVSKFAGDRRPRHGRRDGGHPAWHRPERDGLSPDGSRLWVGVDGAFAIRSVDLSSGNPVAGAQYVLPHAINSYVNQTVGAMTFVGGSSTSLMVTLFANREFDGAVVLDDGVSRGTPAHVYATRIAAGPGNVVFGFDDQSSGFEFDVFTVTPSGFTSTIFNNVVSDFNNDLVYSAPDERVYANSGDVVNVSDPANPIRTPGFGTFGSLALVPGASRAPTLQRLLLAAGAAGRRFCCWTRPCSSRGRRRRGQACRNRPTGICAGRIRHRRVPGVRHIWKPSNQVDRGEDGIAAMRVFALVCLAAWVASCRGSRPLPTDGGMNTRRDGAVETIVDAGRDHAAMSDAPVDRQPGVGGAGGSAGMRQPHRTAAAIDPLAAPASRATQPRPRRPATHRVGRRACPIPRRPPW